MPRIEFTEADLEQFSPQTREALIRLARQQEAALDPNPQLGPRAIGCEVVEHTTHEDFDAEWRRRYKDGAIWQEPPT